MKFEKHGNFEIIKYIFLKNSIFLQSSVDLKSIMFQRFE